MFASVTRDGRTYNDYLNECQAKHICNGSYLVARNEKIVFAAAFGDSGDEAHTPLTIDSAFDIGSISKQFTAMAVLRLVAAGKLSLDANVSHYLPEFPYAEVTVAQLLSHTSGIPEVLPYYTNLLRKGALSSRVTCADVISVLKNNHISAVAPPGTRYEYNNTEYLVLANLVEEITKQPFAGYLEQSFFKPLGMKDTLLLTPGNENAIHHRAFGFTIQPVGGRHAFDQIPNFYIRGGGGIYSTVSDLLRWENALNGGRVIPDRLLKLAKTPTRLSDGSMVPYGFGLDLRPDVLGNSRVWHGGGWRAFKSDLSFYPNTGVAVIQLTNNGENKSVDANAAALAKIAAGDAPPPLHEPIQWELINHLDSYDQALSWFEAENARSPQVYAIKEADLNQLGYALLKSEKSAQSIIVFRLVTLAFPKSANAFDSLTDAYEAVGDLQKAYQSEQKALELAPGSARYAARSEALNKRLR